MSKEIQIQILSIVQMLFLINLFFFFLCLMGIRVNIIYNIIEVGSGFYEENNLRRLDE